MGVAFVPLYIHLLGPEQFGLVGFMLSLQAISILLDFGIGVFLGRELGRRSHDHEVRGQIARLIRTFEFIIWPISAIILISLASGSDAIASHWLNADGMNQESVANAVSIMALAIAFLWPSSFYSSALAGLERQPRLNLIAIVFATLRFAGVLPFLYLANEPLFGFLWWYVAVAVAQTTVTAFALWRVLPASTVPVRFYLGDLVSARHFAFGVFAVTATSLALSQIDRLSLSALRPLSELGYYTVAVTVSGGMGRLIQPIFGAIYPRMSRLVVANDHATVAALYRLSAQGLAVICGSVACIVVVYSREILWLWTGDAALAAMVAMPMSILVVGTALNGLMTAPYALQLAHGHTGLPLMANLVALAVGAPLCLLATSRWGMTGASLLWFGTNLSYLLFVVPVVHRKHLPAQRMGSYLRDIVPPVVAAFVIAVGAKAMHPEITRDLPGLSWLVIVSTITLIMATLSSPALYYLLRNSRAPSDKPR